MVTLLFPIVKMITAFPIEVKFWIGPTNFTLDKSGKDYILNHHNSCKNYDVLKNKGKTLVKT